MVGGFSTFVPTSQRVYIFKSSTFLHSLPLTHHLHSGLFLIELTSLQFQIICCRVVYHLYYISQLI
ncbi:hypothetical protein Lalb_Chr11g0069191 [Lupinus albus]|uniref:Uncharacterized protein n=1 Tax=Lupinus albus TaxID=3870 RepID=A0A6A4PRE5_LUPAL|nr:hypothetical protein Lalb_Chr11g0069191 [Lupinus albus]